jgi:hypothetical protein
MKNKSKFALSSIVLLLAITLLAIGYFSYSQSKNADDKKTKDLQSISDKDKGLSSLDKLKKILYIEDDGKQPAIATVTDAEKLKKTNPDFYKNIQKDDILIVYPSRAIVFRESANQIITVAPITGAETTSVPTNATPAKP